MARPFLETLRELRNGQTLNDLADHMNELVHAVRMTGKGGKLQLTVTVRPASKGDTNAVTVDDEVTIKKPKPDRSVTIFYATADNSLTRQDPRQRDFVLESVTAAGTGQDRPPADAPFDARTGEIA